MPRWVCAAFLSGERSVYGDGQDPQQEPHTMVAGVGPRDGQAEASSPAGRGVLQSGESRVGPTTQFECFAATISGGVNLAMWMGDVAREINLRCRASRLRDEPERIQGGSSRHRQLVGSGELPA